MPLGGATSTLRARRLFRPAAKSEVAGVRPPGIHAVGRPTSCRSGRPDAPGAASRGWHAGPGRRAGPRCTRDAPGILWREGPRVLGPAIAAAVALAASGALPHAPDERMEFAIHYLGVRMGKARISVGRTEGPLLPVFLEARSTGVMSFFTLREQLATYLDLETGLPRSASIDAVEGGYRHTDTTDFDREAGKAKVRERGKFDRTYVVDVPPETLDFVALVFRLRTLPLDPGSRHEFSVLSGRTVAKVVAEVTGRETVSTGAGEFSALKVRVPTSFSGKFSEKHPTYVWFSDDERRIVVRITTEFAIGRATAGLVSYQPGSRAGRAD